jgi:hypothetical protein
MCICNWNFTIFMLKLYMIYLNYSRLERLWKCKQNWKCNDSNVSASLHLMNSHETWSRHLPFRPPTAAINFTTDDTVSDRGFNVSIREVPFKPSICFKFSKINFNFRMQMSRSAHGIQKSERWCNLQIPVPFNGLFLGNCAAKNGRQLLIASN